MLKRQLAVTLSTGTGLIECTCVQVVVGALQVHDEEDDDEDEVGLVVQFYFSKRDIC